MLDLSKQDLHYRQDLRGKQKENGMVFIMKVLQNRGLLLSVTIPIIRVTILNLSMVMV